MYITQHLGCYDLTETLKCVVDCFLAATEIGSFQNMFSLLALAQAFCFVYQHRYHMLQTNSFLFHKYASNNKLTHAMSHLLLVLIYTEKLGLVVMAFGPSYSYSLIRLLYGRKWSDGEASTALRFYCLYVILLAMNGTSEAFLHAVADEIQLKRSNDSLLVFSLIYLVLNVSLIRSAGAIGLILANSLNMALRITYSAVFIRNYFQGSSSFSFGSCLPSGWTFLLLSGVVTLISEKIFLDRDDFWKTFSGHFLVGITSFMLAAFIIYRRERSFINNIIRFREHAD